MKTWVKLVMCVAVVALIFGVTMEIVHLDKQQQCSCCKGKCPNENRCHTDKNDCLCAGKALIQFTLVQSGRLPEPNVFTYSLQKTNLLYSFRFNKDIFHPPKV